MHSDSNLQNIRKKQKENQTMLLYRRKTVQSLLFVSYYRVTSYLTSLMNESVFVLFEPSQQSEEVHWSRPGRHYSLVIEQLKSVFDYNHSVSNNSSNLFMRNPIRV